MKTQFKEQIFMGNGVNSMADSYAIHILVEEPLEAINTIQQQGLYGYTPNQDEIDESQAIIDRNVNQIVIALTGKSLNERIKDAASR